MNILGISAFYHDSAAALVRDGVILAAAQEERFTRKKHDASFPKCAIDYCLKEAAAQIEDLDYVVFYEKPLLKFDRLLETYFAFAPSGFSSFRSAIPVWVREKLFLQREIKKGLKKRFSKPIVYCEHHESHAASAFFPSPFEEAAILTIDGVGEWASSTIGMGKGNRIEIIKQLNFPHSLGLLYSAFTYYCGLKVNSGEYKLMGLAPYGVPRFAQLIRDHLIEIQSDGSFRMNMKYFNYCQGLTMTHENLHRLFGFPPRKPETKLEPFYMDVAASVQKVVEDVMLLIAQHACEITGSENLCLAGGVALNCVANGKILREGPFQNIWAQPASGDAGGALGAACFVWHQLLENERSPLQPDGQRGSFLGPAYEDEEIREFLELKEAVFRPYSKDTLPKEVARLIASEKVVGLFQGRMEFGPRALGNRSILGDARSSEMQKVMNLKIKYRESFRPFAPSVLRERVSDFFEMESSIDSPYMLVVADVHPQKRYSVEGELQSAVGFDKLDIQRSEIPAVTHVDYSARVQTVDQERHGLFYNIIKEFDDCTGCPVVINTSFNVRGEPIVCSPKDAYRCFMATGMDALVLGSFLLLKTEQPVLKSTGSSDAHYPVGLELD
ncbi:MAG: carbamoyltransferase [Verrucomicrobiota bacterium]